MFTIIIITFIRLKGISTLRAIPTILLTIIMFSRPLGLCRPLRSNLPSWEPSIRPQITQRLPGITTSVSPLRAPTAGH
jgi:hypothetical protein